MPQEQIEAFRKKFTREGIAKKHLKSPLCKIWGRYTQAIMFDENIYFDVIKDEPCSLKQ